MIGIKKTKLKAGSVVQEGQTSLWILESYFFAELGTGGTNKRIVTVQTHEYQPCFIQLFSALISQNQCIPPAKINISPFYEHISCQL